MSLKTFTIIGSGNVATHIGKALQRGGYIINGVFSHTLANAKQLAAALHCPATDSIGDVPEADAFLFSVKDSALPSLASEIVKRFGKTPTYIHTAGCIPSTRSFAISVFALSENLFFTGSRLGTSGTCIPGWVGSATCFINSSTLSRRFSVNSL